MSFISANPPNGGSRFSDHRATSLTGRHPFYKAPPFVGTMKNDSSVFHRIRGLSNAHLFTPGLIPRAAFTGAGLRATGKVCRKALHHAETLRALHDVKSPWATPRPQVLSGRLAEREIAHTGLAGSVSANARMALDRKTFARVSSDS
ncbi:hypothetical protein [Caballeronia temeraria]|uniref:hypothetical protein n=1 Tax=Caballeronia temeraria TaxID=1777137 RepID=UPI0012FDA66D|nr:hypothetical protein [Caballeronia temeraria]